MTRSDEKPVEMPLTLGELHIINNALNEVCNGVHIGDFEFLARLGGTREEARQLLDRVHTRLCETAVEQASIPGDGSSLPTVERPSLMASLAWITRPLIADGHIVLAGLDPSRIGDADLPPLCLRMVAILDTIEMARCEGRLMPTELFDRIDTLENQVCRGPVPALAEWLGLIGDFGEHYGLSGTSPIVVDPRSFQKSAARFPGATVDS